MHAKRSTFCGSSLVLVAAAVGFACSESEPSQRSGVESSGGAANNDTTDSGSGAGGSSGSGPLRRCDWARGYAAETLGGQGGEIVRVTSLKVGGEGSLYHALSTPGPKTIVFEVGGVIDLQRATLSINSPYVTIAGQTAPSPGITLIKGGLRVATHDVVVQHIAIRPGEAGQAKQSGWEPDALSTTNGAYNIVVDHVSTTWGVDENLSAAGDRFMGSTTDEWRASTTHNVTFSHNLVAEALYDSTHAEGPHSKGSLMHDNVTGALVYASMYVSNVERNPLFKGGARGVVANNLVINPMLRAMRYNLSDTEWAGHAFELGQMSIVGNDVRYGLDTESDVPLLSVTGAGEVEVYLKDNLAVDLEGAGIPEIGGTTDLALEQNEPPTWPDDFEAMPASEVEAYVVDNVGSRPWDRDPIDERIILDALDGKAAVIDSEQEVGGYPDRPATEAPFDPDEWDLDCMERLEMP